MTSAAGGYHIPPTFGPVMDAYPRHNPFRDMINWLTALDDERIEYRGGGWWRLDGITLRGRRRVVEALR